MEETRYIFITGGVLSGLGKGITTASLGRLLKMRGLRIAAQKMDPYLNVGPSRISPYQHGEVFVTEDGTEADLDLGHYERFIDEDLNQYSSMTSGKVYWNVLTKERAGGFLGQTVQIIPHITDEIKRFIYAVGEKDNADVVITEIGGTIGDIESQPCLEAVRQTAQEVGRSRCMFLHLTLVPHLSATDEYKTKPTQHSVRELQSLGIIPDLIIARCDKPLDPELKRKIAEQCGVSVRCVISNITMPGLYLVPGMLEEQSISDLVVARLGLQCPAPDFTEWDNMLSRAAIQNETVRIALVAKHVQLHDAYLSVVEALTHAGYENAAKIEIEWIDATDLEKQGAEECLAGIHGILIPDGFGNAGIEGMIFAAHYARERNIPFLGICLGMQIAVIEYARHVLGLDDANSSEFNLDGPYRVIDAGDMRLGAYPCVVKPGTRLYDLYEKHEIFERHRHQYEFNNEYRTQFELSDMILAGQSPDGQFVEAVELRDHPYYIGVQYHPEFKSRPNRAHPLFRAYIAAVVRQAR